jgi:hypothetical protein
MTKEFAVVQAATSPLLNDGILIQFANKKQYEEVHGLVVNPKGGFAVLLQYNV